MHVEIAREQMVMQQVRTWDVLDERVLEIMSAVERERFVPPEYRGVAFADTAIPLAHGQHMLQPKVVGRLLQAVLPGAHETVLEIGTGSGYVTACLAAAARQVRSLEIHEDIADRARANLREAGVTNAEVVSGDGMEITNAQHFDAIVVTGSLPLYDERFQQALGAGGRLYIVIGEPPVMEARLVRRTSASSWDVESLFETCVDPLVHAPRVPRFRF